MASSSNNFAAVRLIEFYMRFCGFWISDTKLTRNIMNGMTTYAMGSLLLSFYVTVVDVYHCANDFDKFAFAAVNFSIVGMGLYKVVIFIPQRKKFLELIAYAQNHFWGCSYNDHNYTIMKKCMSRCNNITKLVIVMCHLTLVFYYIRPAVENRGKYGSDRILPFKFWIDFPVTVTPWYEMSWALQVVSSFYCCICFFCFDNFICGINITLVGQLLMLHHELQYICSPNEHSGRSGLKSEMELRFRLAKCINKHQEIIGYADEVKELYKNVILGMVLVQSIQICLQLYQLMTSAGDFLSQIHSCVYVCNTVLQLYFFMLTCNELTEASLIIADSAYNVQWFFIKSTNMKNQLVSDLSLIIIRSQKPLNLAVGGFSAVTLQTFTSICNTAFSYLALMRQSAEKM